MKRIILIAIALAFIYSDNGYARDDKGIAKQERVYSCSEYIDAYLRTTITGPESYYGPTGDSMYFHWLNGFLTAYNVYVENGKRSVLGKMALTDAYKWVAVWCRDNPSKSLNFAASFLIRHLEPNRAKLKSF